MTEPVQTRYGNCFEKQVLAEVFRRNGPKDPVCRLPVDPVRDVFPNLALQALIQAYLRRNPWVFEKTGDEPEDWRNVQFEV